MTFTIDNGLVDTSRSDTIITCCLYTREPLIVAQVEIGLHTIHRHVALTMLVWVQRSWINIDIRIEFLNGNFVTTCLQQFANRRRYDALTKRGHHTTGYEYVLCLHLYIIYELLIRKKPSPAKDRRENALDKIKVAVLNQEPGMLSDYRGWLPPEQILGC